MPPLRSTPNLLFKQYEILGWCEGGMGRVYFVRDQVSGQHRVIKMVKDQARAALAQRFETEAKAWIGLQDHPHIVRAVSFQREPKPYLLEEYVDGPNLHTLIRQEPGGLAFRQAVQFALHVARGLQHAHTCQLPNGANGVIHRDLKPQNILTTRTGQAKIADFGLAKLVGESSLGSQRHMMGTLPYMAPEQLGPKKVTRKIDIYALGVTLYEMLTGRLPHPSGTYHEVAAHIKAGRTQPLSDVRPNIPATLQDFVYQCMHMNKDRRPKAAEAVKQLEALATSLPPADLSACATCGFFPATLRPSCPVCQAPHGFPNHNVPVFDDSPTPWLCLCGVEVPLDYNFCSGCGRTQAGARRCGCCAELNEPGYSFCCKCGAALA